MKTISPLLIACCFALSACNKDFETIRSKNLENSEMMIYMHSMVNELQAMTVSSDPDIDFARMMVMHHQGGINLADVELGDGNDAVLKEIVLDIKINQMRQKQELTAFLYNHPMDTTVFEFYPEAMRTIDRMNTSVEKQMLTGDPDYDFAVLILPHHRNAIEMGQLEIKYGKNDELKAMAADMIKNQEEEIIEVQQWLKENR